MFFFKPDTKKQARKRLKKLKQKKRLEMMRRTHIIIEVRKAHEKSRKQAEKYKAKGGVGFTSSMEDDDLGFAISEGIAKAVQMSGKAKDKLLRRQKSLEKSRNTHLARLKSSRSKMVSRSRA